MRIFSYGQSETELRYAEAALAIGNQTVATDYSSPDVVKKIQDLIANLNGGERHNLVQALALNKISEIRLSNHFEIYESEWSIALRTLFPTARFYVLNLPTDDPSEAENAWSQLYPALIARSRMKQILPGIEIQFELDGHIRFDFQGIENLIRNNAGVISKRLAEQRVARLEFTHKTKLFSLANGSGSVLMVNCVSRATGGFDLETLKNALIPSQN